MVWNSRVYRSFVNWLSKEHNVDAETEQASLQNSSVDRPVCSGSRQVPHLRLTERGRVVRLAAGKNGKAVWVLGTAAK